MTPRRCTKLKLERAAQVQREANKPSLSARPRPRPGKTSTPRSRPAPRRCAGTFCQRASSRTAAGTFASATSNCQFSIDIPLSGPSQGTWQLEALPRGQGALAGLFGKKAVLPVSEQLPGAAQVMWKDRLAGKPGDLLDIVHLRGRHATVAEAREAGYAFRERQVEAEREARRVTSQERRDFNAAAAPWAEALCRHYFPLGVKQDGRWRVRIIHGKKTYLMTAELSGAARGAWKLDETSNTGNLLLGLTGMQTVPACSIPLLGHGHVLWEDKLAGKPGDLLDIVLIREHCRTTAEAMAAGRAFLEGEIKARLEGKHEAQRQLNTALAPHAEALCRRFLPEGVKINGRWRVRLVHREAEYAMNVELSGPERGSWTLKATSGHGALLDIVHKGMTTARALLEGETRPMYVEVFGPGQAMWKDKMLDIVHIRALPTPSAATMAAARAFLEGEHRRRALAPTPRPSAGATSQEARRTMARALSRTKTNTR